MAAILVQKWAHWVHGARLVLTQRSAHGADIVPRTQFVPILAAMQHEEFLVLSVAHSTCSTPFTTYFSSACWTTDVWVLGLGIPHVVRCCTLPICPTVPPSLAPIALGPGHRSGHGLEEHTKKKHVNTQHSKNTRNCSLGAEKERRQGSSEVCQCTMECCSTWVVETPVQHRTNPTQ